MSGALLSLGIKYPDMQEDISENIWAFLRTCTRVVDGIVSHRALNDRDHPYMEEAIKTATAVVALVGFLDAASAQANFWKPRERLALVQKMRQLLSDPFLVAVETAVSTILNTHASAHDREAKEWKRCLRHYAATDRPIGALLLQRSFMWLTVASTSLEIADEEVLWKTHVLDVLIARGRRPRADASYMLEGDIEAYASLIADQMNYVKAGADFVLISSPSHQKLAYELKASALISFMNCSMLNEEVADPEVLLLWLQESLDEEDSTAIADETLASVVLRCLALICIISPASSSAVSRMLTRFVVGGAPQGSTVAVASRSLAFVLKLLSKDAVISTLYTLGNELSPGAEGPVSNGHVNGSVGEPGMVSVLGERYSTESPTAIDEDDEDETALIYSNVVQAICGIATACEDEQITALAQSVLLQKLDKIDTNVDAHIVAGAADLALTGGQLEFRSLLKMYARICHLGVVDNKEYLLRAVSSFKPLAPVVANYPRSGELERTFLPTFDASLLCSTSTGNTS